MFDRNLLNGLIAKSRRLMLALTVIGSTAIVTSLLRDSFAPDGLSRLEVVFLILFAISFSWIALWYWTAVLGGASLALRLPRPGFVWPEVGASRSSSSRTAIVMPIYNEDPAHVFANMQAIYESVAATGQLKGFHFFLLSDTNDPDIWAAEELAWAELCERVQGGGRIFYRRRKDNVGQKSGNIQEFCKRWGRSYDYMVVLDADSVMSGDAIVELRRLMDANPTAGIIQTAPVAVNRQTLFGRLRQFAGRLYAPLFTAGLAYWQLAESCFWGHNAILRVSAFMESCGLPQLPGKPPFGGHIMSHDFVEAALMRRAGWRVWLVPEIGGSYEESPPTLLDSATRDRRWCQGNMQHLLVLPAAGLHPVNRLHILSGIMSYVASVVWLLLIVIGVLMALGDALFPVQYFPEGRTLYPLWPAFDADMAVAIFIAAMGVLLAPKFLVLAVVLASRSRRAGFGGALPLTVAFILETLLSTLLAPITMMFHTHFVLTALLGVKISWTSQRRDDGQVTWDEVCKRHLGHTLFGLMLGAVAFLASVDLFWWLSPVVLGLVSSIPVSYYTSSVSLGSWARRRKLFLIPEEADPALILRRAATLRNEWRNRTDIDKAFFRVMVNPKANALHLAMLAHAGNDAATHPATTPESSETADWARQLPLADLMALPAREKRRLLADMAAMRDAHLRALETPSAISG